MKRGLNMKRIAYSALTMFALVAAQSASAQGISLRGVRADAQVGIDRFYSEGNHDSHLAYGGALGVDTFVGDNFVLGSRARSSTRAPKTSPATARASLPASRSRNGAVRSAPVS